MSGPSVDPGTLPILPGAGVSCLGPLRSHARGCCASTLMCCIRAQFLWGQSPALSSSVLLQLLQTAPESLVQTTSLYQTDMAEACSPGSSDIPSCSLACLKHPPLPRINHQAVNSHPDSTLWPRVSQQIGREAKVFPCPAVATITAPTDPDRILGHVARPFADLRLQRPAPLPRLPSQSDFFPGLPLAPVLPPPLLRH